jgi:hypothetical protein
LSVREAVRYVFPYMHQATINGWIKKGVFLPETYVPAPAMRGRGSKLSISDLVVVGCLHSLFTFGVRFEHIRSKPISDHATKLPPTLFFINDLDLSEQERERLATIEVPGREMQAFLEFVDYNASIHYQPYHIDRRFLGRIIVTKTDIPEPYRIRSARAVILGETVISCSTWYSQVQDALEKIA